MFADTIPRHRLDSLPASRMPAVKIIDADTNEEHLGETISGHVCFWHKADI